MYMIFSFFRKDKYLTEKIYKQLFPILAEIHHLKKKLNLVTCALSIKWMSNPEVKWELHWDLLIFERAIWISPVILWKKANMDYPDSHKRFNKLAFFLMNRHFVIWAHIFPSVSCVNSYLFLKKKGPDVWEYISKDSITVILMQYSVSEHNGLSVKF